MNISFFYIHQYIWYNSLIENFLITVFSYKKFLMGVLKT